ncbi:unnamed protein product [Urochloa decumbens]|uniref:Wall-associated receptor kinase galacturonan-binding domain-containing protein n=1 Tax=Urochloa decumbens TaxID=240449 RepID=A0ABC8Z3P8_9POAL
MAAHLPRLPLLLFVFLTVHVPASHGDPALLLTTYDASMCSDSFMCGGVNITYPFYLSNAIRETADNKSYYSCGYTGLEITCQAGEGLSATPVVRLGGDSYTVLDISYDSNTIILADSDVLLGSPRCPKPHNVTFDHEWLRYNSSSYDNLTFFYDCYSVPSGFDTAKYQINCPGLPVLQRDVVMKYEYMLANGGYGDVLEMGFELEWNRVTTDQCYRCEGSGGRYSYGQSKAFLGCLCSAGKVGNPDCKIRQYGLD